VIIVKETEIVNTIMLNYEKLYNYFSSNLAA